MITYKKTVDFLPKLSRQEEEEKYKVSKAGLYAAVLPLLASVIWIIAVLINFYYKGEIDNLEKTIRARNTEIQSYNNIRKKHSELVLKVESLKDIVHKDFYPQKFFDTIKETIQSAGGAQAEIYSYSRDEEGKFTIRGKANSYIDLAKIMVAFNTKKEFEGVDIRSIYYNKNENNVNFEIEFFYSEVYALGE